MDLSKAYDCLRHDLSIAKSEAYGLANGSLNFLLDYHTFRKQKLQSFLLIVNGQTLDEEFLKDQF